MGICPQQNIIFEDLTVYEHMKLFQRIKGISSSKDTILQSVIDVGLEKKLHTVSKALSGGMKRKLCCAIALVGDPKFVLLDEPTSGMGKLHWYLYLIFSSHRLFFSLFLKCLNRSSFEEIHLEAIAPEEKRTCNTSYDTFHG